MRISYFVMILGCCLLIACEKNKSADQATKISAETVTVKAAPVADEIIVEQKSSDEASNDN